MENIVNTLRKLAAFGSAFLAAHLLLVVAEDVGLLRIVTQDLPLGSLSYYVIERVVLLFSVRF
jgi:hypothetical protein